MLPRGFWGLVVTALAPKTEFHPAKVAVFFSPRGGCEGAVVREIGVAKSLIAVQAYSFTSVPILNALKAARSRGVLVQVLLDRSNLAGKYSPALALAAAGISVEIDAKHAIAHNKVIIIDPGSAGGEVLTGSFNFTGQAEKSNAENLLILRACPDALQAYFANWQLHAAHSFPFTPQLVAPMAPASAAAPAVTE